MQSLEHLLTPFKPINTAEKVYTELKRMLFDYQIVPGQKLQCQDFAEKFNVSRTPVKDALNMLSKEGYVELRYNRGYYVAEIGFEEAESLHDIREALELLSVEKAIRNLNQASLKVLRNALRAYADDVKRPLSRRRLVLDANFHLAIAEMSQNNALTEMIRLIFSKVYLKQRVENLSLVRGKMANLEHRDIYRAISSRNVSEAKSKMKEHLASSRKNVLERLVEEKELP